MKHNALKLLTTVVLFAVTFMLLMTVSLAEATVTLTAEVEQLVISIGKVVTPELTIEPAAAEKAGCLYQSSDENIATVDSRGRVKGIALGECELTITSKNNEAVTLTLPVIVVNPVRKLKAEVANTNLHVGETSAIACSYEPEEATLKQATYESRNETVATVSAEGVITGVSRGQTDIIVKSLDGAAKAQIRIKVLQPPTSITITPETLQLAAGKTGSLKATVLPANADVKTLIWSSSDESVATVDSRGRVKSIRRGNATITATCVDNASVSASVEIQGVQLAKTVAFQNKNYGVMIGTTMQLGVSVSPEDTSNKTVTYKVKNPKIASVNENGVVTGLKGGKTAVTATATDGSKRSGTTTVEVIVPVTGVHFKNKGVRVGVGSNGTYTAILEPKDATDHHMTWESSDERIATVRGDRTKVRILGHRWGRCEVKGTTADGGFTCTLMANIGTLSKAVVVDTIEIQNGEPYIVLANKSNMNITYISFEITGTDGQFGPVQMSDMGDTLYGTYTHPLSAGGKTKHSQFNFKHPTDFPDLVGIKIAVTGWETDTGYYNNNGELCYTYSIPEDKQDWVSWNQPGDM